MEQKIEIWLIRHGKTPENEQHRYIGWLDSSLGSAGKAELIRASETVSKVWVTNRRRTQETAQILFPGAEQILVPGLEEMNFGSFEGKILKRCKMTAPIGAGWRAAAWMSVRAGRAKQFFAAASAALFWS